MSDMETDIKATKTLDVDILLKQISNTFKTYLNKKGFKQTSIEITPFYPQESMKNLTSGIRITYHLENRQPASLDGKPFQNKTFLAPRPFNQTLSVLSQKKEWFYRFDNLIEFQLIALDYDYLQTITLVFEEYMQVARTVFKSHGVEEVLFWERRPDTQVDIGGKVIYINQLRYYVRTIRYFETSEQLIRVIEISLSEQR